MINRGFVLHFVHDSYSCMWPLRAWIFIYFLRVASKDLIAFCFLSFYAVCFFIYGWYLLTLSYIFIWAIAYSHEQLDFHMSNCIFIWAIAFSYEQLHFHMGICIFIWAMPPLYLVFITALLVHLRKQLCQWTYTLPPRDDRTMTCNFLSMPMSLKRRECRSSVLCFQEHRNMGSYQKS